MISFKKDHIVLCIKKQEYLSKWLHEIDLKEDSFVVKGPFGHGMEIKKDEVGTVVLIAMGTAIVAFADLLGYLLRKLVFDRKFPLRVFDEEEFEYLLDVKVVLFYSIKNEQEALHLNLCKKLQKFCETTDNTAFRLEIRNSSQGARRWDSKYFKEVLSGSDVSRVFLASVSGTETHFKSMLSEAGIKKETISIL